MVIGTDTARAGSRALRPGPAALGGGLPERGAGSLRRRALTLTLLGSIVVSFLAASAAPTPMYALYAARWGFSALGTTVVFGVYALAVLAGLLTFGRLSDHTCWGCSGSRRLACWPCGRRRPGGRVP